MRYGSRNYQEQRHRIGKLHEKARNRRKDFLHKLSCNVSRSFDAVIVEDINLQHMSQSLKLGKGISDNGFGMFRTMLAYKLNEQGKVLVKVDRFFSSSKRCCCCHACYNLLREGDILLNRWASGDSSLILAPSGVLSEKKLHHQAHSNVGRNGE